MLEHCLLLQVHLQDDWRARTSYVRTISLALLTWQPWMSRLPGCAFVEESCEAMNSRLAAACRSHPAVTSFEGVLGRYLTLDVPSGEPHHSRGQLRSGLVQDMGRRLRALVANPSGRPFPEPINATRFRWVDGSQTNWMARGPLPRHPDADAYVPILRAALFTVTAGRVMPVEVRDWLRARVADRPPEELESIQESLDRVSRWRTGGRRQTRGPTRTTSQSSNAAAVTPSQVTASQGSQPAVDNEGDELWPTVDEESLYEPPGSDASSSYVSPGWTDDADLESEAETPSPAVTHAGSDLA